MDDERVARETARFYGFSEDEAVGAREVLSPWPDGFAVRFTDLMSFARTFGVSLKSLAEWVAQSTSGIEAWRSTSDISRRDWDRIEAAISATRAAHGGRASWAEAILSLLDELEEQRPAGERQSDSSS